MQSTIQARVHYRHSQASREGLGFTKPDVSYIKDNPLGLALSDPRPDMQEALAAPSPWMLHLQSWSGLGKPLKLKDSSLLKHLLYCSLYVQASGSIREKILICMKYTGVPFGTGLRLTGETPWWKPWMNGWMSLLKSQISWCGQPRWCSYWWDVTS